LLNILCIGAHPDDNELCVGGTAALWAAAGCHIAFVSVTNGDRGHYLQEYIENPASLAERRLGEAQRAAGIIGASYQTLGVRDGEVYPDKPTTEATIRCIRSCGEPGKGPDLVVFNRPQDYHRDHRYTSQLIADASYMLTVPTMCPEVRHLNKMPVFVYWHDHFKDVVPFRPDVVVPIDSVMDTKTRMVCEHESQVFEWLPYNHAAGEAYSVPSAEDPEARHAYIRTALDGRDGSRKANVLLARPELKGSLDAAAVEAFQLCEYGARPTPAELLALFPTCAL
jgi:N-acetylglucosamine malate deacetylase 1